MLAFALFIALQVQAVPDAPVPVAPVTVEPARKRPSPTITDTQIVRQLNDLHRAQPDRVVCVTTRRGHSFIPRTECATLAAWYDMETARDSKFIIGTLLNSPDAGAPPVIGPPDELVTLVKQGMKARAMANAKARKTLIDTRPPQN